MSLKTTPNAQLFTFLLWNALNHAKTLFTRSVSVVVIRWRATRERYELSLEGFRGRYRNAIMNSPDIGDMAGSLFEVIIVIFIVGALIGNVANSTTGITIPHAGFTPNPNLTASPGAVPLTQLFPLVFVAVGLMGAFAYFKHRSA